MELPSRHGCAVGNLRARQHQEDEGAALAGVAASNFSEEKGCLTCGDRVRTVQNGTIVAPHCVSTGSCEQIWTDLHPEQSVDSQGKPRAEAFPCSGLRCRASIEVTANPSGTISARTVGICAIDLAGRDYQQNGRLLLDTMPIVDPDGFEVFDGEQL